MSWEYLCHVCLLPHMGICFRSSCVWYVSAGRVFTAPAAPILCRDGLSVLLEPLLRTEHRVALRLLLSQLPRFQKWISDFIE